MDRVAQTDLFVLLIGETYGEITELEYDHARKLGKPCLVYERKRRMGHDSAQERFLKKLSGPRGVPSRAFFDNAVDLAETIARDVHAWLVREYRRLSAAQTENRDSSRQRADLDRDIAKLTSSVSWSLPTGTSADLLASQLQQWFTALEYPIDAESESNDNFVDLVVRVPARRKRYTTVLVRAKDGEIQSPDIEATQTALNDRPIDEVWLVSFRRISPAARKAAKGKDWRYFFTRSTN